MFLASDSASAITGQTHVIDGRLDLKRPKRASLAPPGPRPAYFLAVLDLGLDPNLGREGPVHRAFVGDFHKAVVLIRVQIARIEMRRRILSMRRSPASQSRSPPHGRDRGFRVTETRSSGQPLRSAYIEASWTYRPQPRHSRS